MIAPVSPDGSESPILVAANIDKTFDRTKALVGAQFELRAGEIHGLVGANGAGKSTLSKVISGHVMRDAGEIAYKGQALNLRNTREALGAGIAIVMQETTLAPHLSVLENIFLPEFGRPGRLSFGVLRLRADELLSNLGHEHALPLDINVERLSAAQRQLVEIAKALALDADLIIFDEPTASLSPSEVERLFDIMAKLRADGRALIFVSHRMEEIFAITDRVTIMREGRTVLSSQATSGLTQADVIRHMVGRDIGALYATPGLRDVNNAAPIAFSVENLATPPVVRNVSFSVRAGEILGLGGLVGAGRSETVEAIFGLRRRTGGAIRIGGTEIAPHKPADAVRAGIGFVAEDRRVQNIVPHLSVKENLLLAHLGAHSGFGLGYGKRQAKIDQLMKALGLPADRLLDTSMLNFSGGMQQKIIIARWLLLEPKVLILDEPTKGVDIATRQAIYEILRDIASQGVAMVVISSDFEELLGVCERIVVMSDGYTIADLPSAMLDKEKLTLLAAPRTSMKRNTAALGALSNEYKGAGFWALLDEDRLICLNTVVTDDAAAPGFVAGDAKLFDETRIATALQRRDDVFVSEPDGGRSTILVPVSSRRGHDLGWIGLTLRGDATRPPAEAVRQKIEELNAQSS